MEIFFGEEISLGPREIINVLLTPLSDLGLDSESCKILISHDLECCYDLLFFSENQLFEKAESSTRIFLKLKKVIKQLEEYGFCIGMLSQDFNWLKCLLDEVKSWRKYQASSKLMTSLKPGNPYPAFPRSEANYYGSIPGGEW